MTTQKFGGAWTQEKLNIFTSYLEAYLIALQNQNFKKIYIDAFAVAGSDNITFHVEAADDPAAVIDKIHSRVSSAGISVKPGTPVSEIEPYISSVELVLVMTVEPGFGGQGFIEETVSKIKQCRELIDRSGKNVRLEVDGGINAETARLCRQAGADTFVSGTYLFNADDMAVAVKTIID